MIEEQNMSLLRRSSQPILKEINPGYSLEGLMLKLKLQYFDHLVQRADFLKKTLMLGKTEVQRRRGRQRMRWLGMASPTQWTWIWANSGRQWRTEEPGSRAAKSWIWLNDWTTTTAKCWGEKTAFEDAEGKTVSIYKPFWGDKQERIRKKKKKGNCSLWQRRDLPHLAYVNKGVWEAGRELWPLDSCSAFWRGAENEKHLVLFKMNHSLC